MTPAPALLVRRYVRRGWPALRFTAGGAAQRRRGNRTEARLRLAKHNWRVLRCQGLAVEAAPVHQACFFALGSGASSSGWLMMSGAPVVSLAYSVFRGSISTMPLSVIMYSRMSLL